jgi:TRAP-type C4-dicarboxylate transport system permease small subunit
VTEQLKRLDRLVYQAERAFVVFALLAMAFAVVIDVVHRAASGDGAKLVDAVAKVTGWFGPDIEAGSPAYQRLASVTPWLLFGVLTGLGWFGIRTATRPRSLSHARAAAFAAAGVVVLHGLVQLLVRLLPNGLIWSQPFALVLTLWVGFVGASMATYENKHLKVDAMARVIPLGLRKWVAFVSALLTATICFALMYLSIRYVRFNYDEYTSTAGRGGLVQGLDLPKYLAFMALPLSFAIMTLRFLAVAAEALAGRLQDSDPLAGLVDEATKQALAVAVAPESEIPTEAIRAVDHAAISSSGSGRRGSARPGPRSGSFNADAPSQRPSEVVTDRHASSETADDVEPVAKTPADDPEAP